MAIQPHSRIESQLTDPTYNGPYLSRIELILKDMLENYGRIAFVGPYDSLEDLPETGQAGYVYLVRVEGSNLCDEYIWDEQEEEYNYVGRFEIDLADYQTKDLSNPITIDSVVYTTVEAALAAMNTSLSGKANSSDLGTAASKNSTNQLSDGSVDLIEAGAVKTALDSKEESGVAETLVKDTVGWSGKNKLPLTLSAIKSANTDGTWSGNSYTYRDVVWTIQTDDGGIVTEINANGTANASSFLYLYYPSTGEQLTQDMVLNGCPAGGDDATKYILAAWQDGGNMEIDEGEGVTVSSGFTLNSIYAVVRQGFNAQNLTFHPMFRLSSISDSTFEPYHATVDTVKADKVTSPIANDLASLDSNGNLADSGISKEVLSTDTTTTAAGNPITFATKSAQIATGIEVDIKPIQNLHGYDHPWPAGGGKNKMYCELQLPYDTGKGIVVTSDGNGGVYLNGTSTDGIIIGNVFKTDALTGQSTFCKLTSAEPDGLVYIGHWPNGDYYSPIAGFETAGTDGYWEMGVYFPNSGIVCNNVHLTPMVIMGNTHDADYAPYSNICPISGIDEVEIGVNGKNLFDVGNDISEWLSTSNDGTKITSNPISRRVTANLDRSTGSIVVTNYDTIGWWWMSKEIKLAKNTNYKFVNLRVGKKILGFNSLDDGSTGTVIAESDSDSIFNSGDYKYWVLSIFPMNVNTNNVMVINDGVADTEFEPYKGEPTTTTIPLPSTLYGGTVDVTEGDVDSRSGFAEFDGSEDENWFYENASAGKNFYIALQNAYAPQVAQYGLLCNQSIANNNPTTAKDKIYISFAGNLNATFGDTLNIDSVNKWREYLSQHPLQVKYVLATPTTISFDPTDVELLEGTNVVSTNGEKVAVTYRDGVVATLDDIVAEDERVDAKLTEGLGTKAEIPAIADSEPNATASQPYAVREHFYKNGKFCTAISEIASGATFTKGTNYVEGTIANNMVKQATFSGTTSNDGNLKLSNSVITILSAIVTDVSWCVAIPYVSNGNTFIHVIADDGSNTVRSSTAISGIYFYI